MIADSAQGDVEHGHNALAERFVAVKRYGAKKFLAFGVAGIVGARVRL
jgi:hypothetical protein